jgi:hypothetical protein
MFDLGPEFLRFFLLLLVLFEEFGGGRFAEASLEFLVGFNKNVSSGHFVGGL